MSLCCIHGPWDESQREWQELSPSAPQILVDRRVLGCDLQDAIRTAITDVTAAEGVPPTRVLVIPADWQLDENFSSVALRFFFTPRASFVQVYHVQSEVWTSVRLQPRSLQLA